MYVIYVNVHVQCINTPGHAGDLLYVYDAFAIPRDKYFRK